MRGLVILRRVRKQLVRQLGRQGPLLEGRHKAELVQQLCLQYLHARNYAKAFQTWKRCVVIWLPVSACPKHNEEVKARTGNAIGPYEDLLTPVKRRNLKLYGHVTRSSGLAKTIPQGTVQGERRRGRQRKRWEGNIKEWTGLEWDILLQKAENREEWRKLVVKS